MQHLMWERNSILILSFVQYKMWTDNKTSLISEWVKWLLSGNKADLRLEHTSEILAVTQLSTKSPFMIWIYIQNRSFIKVKQLSLLSKSFWISLNKSHCKWNISKLYCISRCHYFFSYLTRSPSVSLSAVTTQTPHLHCRCSRSHILYHTEQSHAPSRSSCSLLLSSVSLLRWR